MDIPDGLKEMHFPYQRVQESEITLTNSIIKS